MGKTTVADLKPVTRPFQIDTPTELTKKPDNTALTMRGKPFHILYMEFEIVIFFITKVFFSKDVAGQNPRRPDTQSRTHFNWFGFRQAESRTA